MKSNKKKVGLFIFLGIILAFSTLSNLNISTDQRINDNKKEVREDTNLSRPKTSGWWDNFTFIHINGNWSIAAGYEWCTGDGSLDKPYTIENITMNAGNSPTGSGIYIQNSHNDYFIIRNCTVYNSASGAYDAGIKLENTNKGTLTNNNCSDNGMNNILLYNDCDNNTLSENFVNGNTFYGIIIYNNCDNNTIIGNTVNGHIFHGIYLYGNCLNNAIKNNIASDNDQRGIFLWGCSNNFISGNNASDNGMIGIDIYSNSHNNTISRNIVGNFKVSPNQDYGLYSTTNCDNNTIKGNFFKDNTQYGIYIAASTCWNNLLYQNSLKGNVISHARDDGTNNHWNNSRIGNYWDNHTIPDTNKNGIVDTPYKWIIGTAGSNDSFPLAESPVHDGEKIHIDDTGMSALNWSILADLTFWCTGSGTLIDPYIIDGLEIDCANLGNGILVGNSSVYFNITNCSVYKAGSGIYDAGIKLENTNNGSLINNTCLNNGFHGIHLNDNCNNNTIIRNILKQNGYGIYVYNNCTENYISDNTANDNGNGITLNGDCNNNTITGNNVNDNTQRGIYLYKNCKNNTISENKASYTGINTQNYGISLNDNCDKNTISGNTACDNDFNGIFLENHCDNNTISGNNANNNSDNGIYLNSCDNNTILLNTASDNDECGIKLWLCSYNNVTRNIMIGNDNDGIYLRSLSEHNIISENYANNNAYGICLNIDCRYNNFTQNYLYYNKLGGFTINTSDCIKNLFELNVIVSTVGRVFFDGGTNTILTQNYLRESPPSFIVEVIAQSFSISEFVVTLNISSYCIGLEVSTLTFQMWWNGTTSTVNYIADLGQGLYNISLTPILVEPDEDPILFNMTISALYHRSRYFTLNLKVDPETVDKNPEPTPTPSDGGGGGGGDGDGEGDTATVVIGTNLAAFTVGILTIVSIMLIKKRKKLIRK